MGTTALAFLCLAISFGAFAADPPVDAIALQAARDIVAAFRGAEPHMRITVAQLRIIDAVNEALDRCQALGGRRTK